MARNINGADKFEFNRIQRKFIGELLQEKMHGLYIVLPYATLIFSCLFLIGASLNLPLFSQIFYALSWMFLSLTALFIYFVYHERADVACLGVINEARDTQLAYAFKLKKANKKIKYYAKVGVCVHEFLGKDEKEARIKDRLPHNLKYDLLPDKKQFTMGYNMPGSTGSGKTVSLNASIFLPAIKSGNGFFYLEGKGDRPITEALMAFIYQYGREKDVYILDFGAAASGGTTNGLNPLAIGNAKTVGEFLKNLITVMTGDNAWVTDMAIANLESNLLPLVLLRDLNLLTNPKELKQIQTLEDLEKREKYIFNMTTLLYYFDFQTKIDLYYMMKRLFKDPKFVQKLKEHEEYKILKRNLEETFLGPLDRNLTSLNIDIHGLAEPVYADLPQELKRNHPKAADNWIQALEKFANEKFYGNVLNKDEPDFEGLTAIQTGKIIISILPSISGSKDTNEKIGKMMTSVAKSAIGDMLEKGELAGKRRDKKRQYRWRPRKLPYPYVFDEPSNYANEDITQLSSMIRAIGSDGGGMALVWTGQSKSDMDKIDDKQYASQQGLANMGITHCLNIADEGWIKMMKEKTGEHYVVRENQFEGNRSNQEDNNFREIRREKEEKFSKTFFERNLRPQTGESIIVMKGYLNDEKVVTNFYEPPSTDIVINQNISWDRLSKTFKTKQDIEKDIEKIKKAQEISLEKILLAEEGLDKTFEQEVKDGLLLLARTAFPALPKLDSFKLTLYDKIDHRAHGRYTFKTHHIEIYNVVNKQREHVIATAIHELAHHIQYLQEGQTGHAKSFYKLMYELICYAMGLEDLNFKYDEAKRLNMVDARDIEIMEKHFGSPKIMIKD